MKAAPHCRRLAALTRPTPIHFHQTPALLEDCHSKLSQITFLLKYLTKVFVQNIGKRNSVYTYIFHRTESETNFHSWWLIQTFMIYSGDSCGQFLRPPVQSFCHFECSTTHTTGSNLLSLLSDSSSSVYSRKPECRAWRWGRPLRRQ